VEFSEREINRLHNVQFYKVTWHLMLFKTKFLIKRKYGKKISPWYKNSHKNTIASEFIECQQVFSLMAYMWALKNHSRG